MGEYWDEGMVSRRGLLKGAAVVAAAAGMASFAGCSSAGAEEGGVADNGYVAQPLLTTYAEPPLATIEEKQSNKKKVLVVVDYQVDFVDGSLGTNDLAIAIEDAIYNKVKEYQDNGDIVCYTMDTHPEENYELTREGQRISTHCVPGTSGWEVYGKVKEILTPETAYMVKKGTYGSKYLPDVLNAIKNQGTLFESIELAGVSTNACVFHNAVILYNMFPECDLIMDQSTTAGKSAEVTESCLEQLEGWGVKVVWQ